jgi:hypothetical protein
MRRLLAAYMGQREGGINAAPFTLRSAMLCD